MSGNLRWNSAHRCGRLRWAWVRSCSGFVSQSRCS